jgi:hypothetical protein
MVNEVISDASSPERADSARKTTVLRQFLRDLFSQNVDRQLLPSRRLDHAESVKQILSKRHTDVIQKTVEIAAAKNLPVEASFEHRHEVKGEATSTGTSPKTPKKPSATVTAAQKRRARLAAQKFVEPVTTLPLVPLSAKSGSIQVSAYNYGPLIRRSMALAVLAAVVIGLVYVVR